MLLGKPKSGADAQARAAALLITEGALVELSSADAQEIVGYMQPHRARTGDVIIRQGDVQNSDFMALVLDGEVTVENTLAAAHDSMVVSVLGPGSLIGEMGLLDTGPRSASCTASTDIQCAVLTRKSLEALIEEQPGIGAKFLLAVSARIAERYRDTQKKLKLFARLASTMQEELQKFT